MTNNLLRMKKIVFASFAAFLFLTSCADRFAFEEKEKTVQFVVCACLDTTDTKTTMTDDGEVGKVKWSETDYLVLYNSSQFINGIASGTAQRISEDGNQAYFYFSVEENVAKWLPSQGNFLLYGDPANVKASAELSSVKFTVNIDAHQVHPGVACFSEFENIAFGFCPAGTFQYEESSGNYIGTAGCMLRNAFGILKVPVALSDGGDASRIRYVRLTDKKSGNYLAGQFKVTVSEVGDFVGAPKLERVAGSGGESRTIEKSIPAGTLAASEGYVYFMVPPGTLFSSDGFGLAVYTDDGYYGSKTVTPQVGSGMAIERSKITQLTLSPFKPKKFPEPIPLTANSYIFSSAAGVETFPAHYKGNGYQGNGAGVKPQDPENTIAYNSGNYAELVWQTKSNGETLLAAEVVDSPVYYVAENGEPYISFHKAGVPGNALIALKNASGEILWSWHVWVTPEKAAAEAGVMLKDSDGTEVIKIMDRNLGALYADPTVSGQETQTHGLGYQFGRKDPYMGSRYTHTDQGTSTEYASYASIYPGTAIFCVEDNSGAKDFDVAQSVLYPFKRSLRSSKDWCKDLVSWGDLQNPSAISSPKTLYDPCPVGWRTAEETTLNCISNGAGEVVESGKGFAFKLLNFGTPIYFPAGGQSETSLAVTNVGAMVSLWGANYSEVVTDQENHTQAHYLQITLDGIGDEKRELKAGNMAITMAVRCQKWDEPSEVSCATRYKYGEINEGKEE